MNQRLLSGEQEYIQDPRDEEIVRLRQIKGQLDEALRLERIRSQSLESGARELKHVLTPLYRALQKVFGEFNDMDIVETVPVGQSSAKKEIWDMWKQKLGNQCARIIEALLAHGTMTRTQICIATGISGSNIAKPISKLYTTNLLNKNGNEYSLKQL